MNRRPRLVGPLRAIAPALVLSALVAPALADGTETLGPPVAFPIATGSGLLAAGIGLDTQPGSFSFTVPAGATVQQVIAYWGGQDVAPGLGDDTINFNGNAVMGTLIGGPTVFFNAFGMDIVTTNYRADITGLGLVSPGVNNLTVDGMSNGFANDGAGVIVIFDEGDDSEIGVRDGNDDAFTGFAPPLDTTVAQTFNFASASSDRTADLGLFVASVGCNRPNQVNITVNGTTTSLCSPVGNPTCPSLPGQDFWEALDLDVTIPAGTTSLTVQVLSGASGPCMSSGALDASLNWVCAALSVPPPDQPPGGQGCTLGYWKNHLDSWPPTGYSPAQTLGSVFSAVTTEFPSLASNTLLQALNYDGGPTLTDKAKLLLKQAVAALLSAAHPDVNYPLTEMEVINMVNAALMSGSRMQIQNLQSMLDMFNNLGCPLN